MNQQIQKITRKEAAIYAAIDSPIKSEGTEVTRVLDAHFAKDVRTPGQYYMTPRVNH